MRLTRLRWQLTLSHLVAIAFTLVLMVAATVLLWSGWAVVQSNPIRDTAQDARIVARAVDDLIADGATRAELGSVLRSLASGRLRPFGAGPFPPEAGRRGDFPAPVLRNLAYAVVLGPDGTVLGSSDPGGAAFSPPERSEWDAVVPAALAGERDPRRLVVVRSGSGPAALGAAPVVDDDGRAVAAVVVAKSVLPAPDRVGSFWRALAVFSAATVALLGVAFVFALASATLLGYLLSRRLVSRLERLGRAAEGLAAGDLGRRVEEGPPDEVGQLARRFNAMADRLAATMAELETRQGQTEALLRAKRELVANVSHELRTPLATIRGYTESLLMDGRRAGDREPNGRDDADEDDRRRSLAVIHRETEQLSRLIDDLFLLSTAEAGGLELTIRPVALGEVVEGVADGLRPAARREREVTVVTEVDPALPPALADRERVVQVLSNLARNAVRHTPEGGLVALRAGRQDGLAVVTVEDTGIGIPPDQLAHVFERFYRGDAARDRSSGGAGLGLAIVRELVEAMGGTVSAESTPGQGSRFSFTLPLAPAGEETGLTAGRVAAAT